MNKKLLITLLIGVLALTVVSAGVMLYYGQINAKIDVTQPISVAYLDGKEWVDFTGTFFTDELEVTAGEEVDGARIRIENSADSDKKVVISEVVSETGIETDYGMIICVAPIEEVNVDLTIHLYDEDGNEIEIPEWFLTASSSIGFSEGIGIEGIIVDRGTQISIPAEGSCWLTIEYTADSMLTDGTYIVKTKIDSAEYTILPAE